MEHMMAVLLNKVAQLEYDRTRPLTPFQGAYLEKMDQKLESGIDLGDVPVAEPDIGQKAQFVAANLHHAIVSDDEQMAGALCSWLATRLPDLKQVKIEDSDGEVSIELVFDEVYQKQIEVAFDGQLQ